MALFSSDCSADKRCSAFRQRRTLKETSESTADIRLGNCSIRYGNMTQLTANSREVRIELSSRRSPRQSDCACPKLLLSGNTHSSRCEWNAPVMRKTHCKRFQRLPLRGEAAAIRCLWIRCCRRRHLMTVSEFAPIHPRDRTSAESNRQIGPSFGRAHSFPGKSAECHIPLHGWRRIAGRFV